MRPELLQFNYKSLAFLKPFFGFWLIYHFHVEFRLDFMYPTPNQHLKALKKALFVFLCIKGTAYLPLSKICAPFPLPTPEP